MNLLILLACTVDSGPRLYHTEPVAPSLDPAAVANLDHLGPTLVDDGVNFGVYSARAEKVDLLLFDDPNDPYPVQQVPMERFGDVWNIHVEGVGKGQLYGFAAWGPNWPYSDDFYPGSRIGFVADVDGEGNRFNPNKLLFDPYARALSRDHDWGAGSAGTGELRREESTWGAGTKGVVVESEYTWSEHEDTWRALRASGDHAGHRWEDLVLYEVHVKGFSRNGVDGVSHPGTYRGMGEKASYFKDLGINAVELLPVHEKPLDGGYWGYNNTSYHALELAYSADYDPDDPRAQVIDEFKWMVDQLHQQGIEVIVDVVYNHTGEGGLWREKLYLNDSVSDQAGVEAAVNLDSVEVATLFNYRGLDNWSYYALTADGREYWNDTGVGNQTRANNHVTTRLILDSLHTMVEELHVDGFRFDLAPILGVKDLDYTRWDDVRNTVLQAIADDPVLQAHNTRIIAEPWAAGGDGWKLGAFPASTSRDDVAWGEWNAYYRDWWRSFINEDGWTVGTSVNGEGWGTGGSALTGSYELFGATGRRPYHSTNFVTVHDGFTMYDLFSYWEKQNECGVLNPVCCDDPTSPWCETDSGESHNRSRDWGNGGDPAQEPMKRQMMRNMFLAMLVSHGTPLLYGGDEWMRTQYGNNNAYSDSADNEWNWFRWGEWQSQDVRWRMHDFVSEATRLRREHAYAFARAAYGEGSSFSWKSATGGETDWNSRHLVMHYDDPSAGPELYVVVNGELGDTTFSLPSGTWEVLADTQDYYDRGDVAAEGSWGWFVDSPGLDPRVSQNIRLDAPPTVSGVYTAKSRTIVILRKRA